MKKFVLPILIPLSFLAAGCTTLREPPPKPVAKVVKPKQPVTPRPAEKKSLAPHPVAKKPAPGTGTATYAIDDGKNAIKAESTTPLMQVQPLPLPVEGGGLPLEAASVPQAALPAATPGLIPTPTSVQPAVLAISVEDMRLPAGSQPAVVALLSDAERKIGAGDLDAAVVSTERALRIDSRNPVLTYKLAQLRLRQNKPQLAEELAGKAALLAGGDLDLKRKSWLLIAEARRLQQNFSGAQEAKAKADSFFGR